MKTLTTFSYGALCLLFCGVALTKHLLSSASNDSPPSLTIPADTQSSACVSGRDPYIDAVLDPTGLPEIGVPVVSPVSVFMINLNTFDVPDEYGGDEPVNIEGLQLFRVTERKGDHKIPILVLLQLPEFPMDNSVGSASCFAGSLLGPDSSALGGEVITMARNCKKFDTINYQFRIWVGFHSSPTIGGD